MLSPRRAVHYTRLTNTSRKLRKVILIAALYSSQNFGVANQTHLMEEILVCYHFSRVTRTRSWLRMWNIKAKKSISILILLKTLKTINRQKTKSRARRGLSVSAPSHLRQNQPKKSNKKSALRNLLMNNFRALLSLKRSDGYTTHSWAAKERMKNKTQRISRTVRGFY